MKTKQLIAIAMMNEKANSKSVSLGFRRKSNASSLIPVPTPASPLYSRLQSLWAAMKTLQI